MTQKLTEEQQRAAHKRIVKNRGDCAYKGNYLNCHDCPKNSESFEPCDNFPGDLLSPEFQAENLRRSQAWLDAHITDAEILAESSREFCERMVRGNGYGLCKGEKINGWLCRSCVLHDGEKKLGCNGHEACLERAKAYLDQHSATTQEPAKRRPTPEEMVVGAPVRVRLWDELVRDGVTKHKPNIPTFTKSMKIFCGNTYKIIKRFDGPIFLRVYLENCCADCWSWNFTPEMLDYVEPEKVVDPKPVANAPKPEAKEKSDTTVKGDVDKLPLGLRFINFRDLLPVDALRIIALERQVEGLTKKLTASTKLCERLQRRLRANWEAKRDGEMATREEIIAWFDAGKGGVIISDEVPKISPNDRTDWIPATRGNLKL